MGTGQGLESGGQGLDHHHHPRPTAERCVVDLAVIAEAMLPQVDQVDLEGPACQWPGPRCSPGSGLSKNSGKMVTTLIFTKGSVGARTLL